MMKNQEILNTLNEIDKYLRDNIKQNCRLKNSDEIYARINILAMQKLRQELDKKGIQGIIRNRFEQTENALLYAANKAVLNRDNKYFEWLNQTNKKQPYYIQLYYDVCTGHESILPSDNPRDYLPDNVPDREMLLYNIEMIQREYEEFRQQDRQHHRVEEQHKAMTVQKRNPIKSFFEKIFGKGTHNKTKEQEVKNMQQQNNGHRKYCEELSNYGSYNSKQAQKRHAQPQQTIVISDLHGDIAKWEWVKQAMSKNPNMKIIILGDAMDRGDYGVEILLQIKELCDQGKAEYLPGNHDVFAYNYVKTKEILSQLSDSQKMQNRRIVNIAGRELGHLMKNGGEETLEKLDNFSGIVEKEIRNGNIKCNISRAELINWLGKQPIQKKINSNNVQYALSHAYFDEDLYQHDANFNMEKALSLEINGKSDLLVNKFKTAMWYREGDAITQYAPVTFPKGCVMVVGHTVQSEINISNFQNDPYQPVIYIDTGKNAFAGWNISNGKIMEFESRPQYSEGR